MMTLPIKELGIFAILENGIDKIEIGYCSKSEKIFRKVNEKISSFNDAFPQSAFNDIAVSVNQGFKIIYFSIGIRTFGWIGVYSKLLRQLVEKYSDDKKSSCVIPITNGQYLQFMDEIKEALEEWIQNSQEIRKMNLFAKAHDDMIEWIEESEKK